MATPRKTRVAIVFGGRSTEHAISCVSAGSILGALDPDEYEVVPVGITRQGAWVLAYFDPLPSLATPGPAKPRPAWAPRTRTEVYAFRPSIPCLAEPRPAEQSSAVPRLAARGRPGLAPGCLLVARQTPA